MNLQKTPIRDAADQLDVEDLNFVSSSESLGIYKYKPPSRWKRGIWVNMATFSAKWLRATAVATKSEPWSSLQGKDVIVPITSLNQLRSVAPVTTGFAKAGVLSLHRDIAGPRFPEFMAYGRSLRFLGRLLDLKSRAAGYRRIGLMHDLDRYLLTYGYFITSVRLLRRLRPKLVLVSNDHIMETRTFVKAAAHLGIRAAYVQHASVSAGFPPLAFDIAFLDGRDAAEKYDVPGPGRPLVFLSGIPKADEARSRARPRTALARLGICVNVLDPMEPVRDFANEMRLLAPEVELVLRPHPSDRRPWGSRLPGVEVSDSKEESSFDFLDRVDAIVTGPSNIALEAALVGVRSVFVDFGKLGRDHYGFVRRGLCERAETPAAALELLDPRRSSVEVASALKAYCATVGTVYDGRSSQLVRELITEDLQGGICMSRWQSVPGFAHIDVFELMP